MIFSFSDFLFWFFFCFFFSFCFLSKLLKLFLFWLLLPFAVVVAVTVVAVADTVADTVTNTVTVTVTVTVALAVAVAVAGFWCRRVQAALKRFSYSLQLRKPHNNQMKRESTKGRWGTQKMNAGWKHKKEYTYIYGFIQYIYIGICIICTHGYWAISRVCG